MLRSCDNAFVQRAGAKSLQIDRDKRNPIFLKLALDGVANLRLEDARDFAALQFQPRNLAMEAHARDFEAHRMQQTLRRRNFFQPSTVISVAVRKARRRGTATPDGPRSASASRATNSRISALLIRFDQRMAHALLARGLHPGPVVMQVVEVEPVDNVVDTSSAALGLANREQICLHR